MAAVFEYSTLPTVSRFVLVALADHADHDGYAWPAVDRLAHKTGLSRRSVQRALSDAELAGELVRTVGTGRGNPSLYQITVGPVDISPDFSTKGVTLTPFKNAKGRHSRRERVSESATAPLVNRKEPRARAAANNPQPLPPKVPDRDLVRQVDEIRAALQSHPAGAQLELVEDEGPA
jgi:hypothetical protein